MDNDEKLRKLKAACRLGRYDFDELIEQCRTGEAQFWELDNAVAVTTLMVSGPHRVCYITAVAGTLDGVAEMARTIDTFAANQGCDVIRTVGRLGFKETSEMLDPDYRPIGIMYEKAVHHGS